MSPAPAQDRTRDVAELAVWLGGVSVACWLCCPFWTLISFLALPAGLAGLVRSAIEYRASAHGRTSRTRAAAGGALSLMGTGAAIAYLVFVAGRPDLPVQG
ncbi:hypothetical protein [Streptomyces sp. NPDC052701]|uniref:hypothetical protein n=1 Tax=Streptomyces sp. NPDC052701 TaxID=3155533 RepID=UPI0034429C17